VLVAAVSGTAALLLRDLQASKTEDVQRSLDVNLAVLKDQLRPLGTTWQTDGTTLKLGDTVVNGKLEVVDRVKAIAGGVATVFLGDTRIGRVGESAASAALGGDAIRRDAGTLSGQAEALRAAVRGLVAELRAA
jgi:hypothetical protein